MAKSNMKFILVKNNLPTAKEPYVGQFVSNGTTDLDAFAAAIADGRTNVDTPTVKLVLRTAFEVIGDDIASDLTRIDTGIFSFEPAISGSVASMDGALGDANEVYIAVRTKESLRKEIAAITPSRETDDTHAMRFDFVYDISGNKRGQIKSTEVFRLIGRDISAVIEGESVTVIDSAGVEHSAQVHNENGAGQRISAQLNEAPALGKATVVLKTYGYAPGGTDLVTLKKQAVIVE